MLLGTDGYVKLADLGLSKQLLPAPGGSAPGRTRTLCGTPAYFPPEMVVAEEVRPTGPGRSLERAERASGGTQALWGGWEWARASHHGRRASVRAVQGGTRLPGTGCSRSHHSRASLALPTRPPAHPPPATPTHALQRHYGFEVDLWGLGCIIHDLLLGFPPFHRSSPAESVQ